MALHAFGAGSVRHYVAGGTEHGGGIGRLVGYVCAAGAGDCRHLVTDTRGPRWNRLRSPFRLAHAMGALLSDRLTAPERVHQIHVAGRGSTARKTVLGLWAQLLGARYVVHLHDYDYANDLARRPDWQRRAIGRVFRGARQVIVLGQRDRRTVETLLDVPADRISVLRNCVPDPGPRPPRDPAGPVRILFLGTLGPRKGVPELIAALSDPAMPATGWQATLAGDGPVEVYQTEIAARGLADRVELPGWLSVERTAALLSRADILVLPSHAEGFAMAVLEGLAHGLAVVTTRVGAHDEVLEHDETCLFVPVGDAAALARALAALVGDRDLRDRLSAAARRLFLADFDIAGYVARLERLHSDVLKGLQLSQRQA